MGRKIEMEGSGSLAKYMAQKSPCSVLFLTEKAEISIPEKVLIPLDFSEHSHLTFQFARKLFEETNTKILGLHIYQVPIGYYKTGKSYDEFARIMEGHARKDYEKFLHKFKHQNFECLFLMNENENAGKFITGIAQENQADWIIMGSRGRTSSASVLLGSIAENLVESNNKLPMLIFKKKGENMNLIDAILKI
jgi:nucleotide-binding universal stress UspA family protein